MAFVVTSFAARVVHSQSYDISPGALDFGCVDIDNTDSDMVTFENTSDPGGPAFLVVASVENSEDNPTENAFSLLPTLPGNVSPGDEPISFDVVFNPQSIGTFEGTLTLTITNDQNDDEVIETVTLIGTGGSPGDPIALMDSIIDFFNDSIADGTLESTGPSGNRRYKALRCRLKAVDWLIRHEYYVAASDVLETAILRTDGEPRPKDFVQGSNLQSLNDQLMCLQMLLDE